MYVSFKLGNDAHFTSLWHSSATCQALADANMKEVKGKGHFFIDYAS